MHRLMGLALMLTLFVSVLAPSSARAAVDTCQGLPATIVGSPGSTLKGTAGDDVIVSNGASRVFADGGNDTICTTGSVPPGPDPYGLVAGDAVVVEGGPGVNVVDRRGDLDPTATATVFEANTFYGSEARDVVTLSATNVVATGGGDDRVLVGDAPVRLAEMTGSVDLGPGDDEFRADGENGPVEPPPFRALAGSALAVDGGGGEDQLVVLPLEAGRWTMDVVKGRLSTRTSSLLAFGGFEDYESGTLNDHVRVDFIGSRRDETFTVDSLGRDSAVRTVRMGGGDDEIRLYGCGACSDSRQARLDGGPGRDLLQVADQDGSRLLADLTGHRLVRTRAHGPIVTRLGAIEDLQAVGQKVTVRGDDLDNDLRAWGCLRNVIRGGDGDDVLHHLANVRYGSDPPSALATRCEGHVVDVVAHGGPGRDLLVGSSGPDLLDGGPGPDTARAGQGTDRCPEVEARTGCERG